MGLWALWTFLGGLLLLAGMQGWGFEQGEGWGWLSPEGVCGVCGLTGARIQSGFSGPWLLPLGYGGEAGLSCLWRLWLSWAGRWPLEPSGARAPDAGAPAGEAEVAPSQPE